MKQQTRKTTFINLIHMTWEILIQTLSKLAVFFRKFVSTLTGHEELNRLTNFNEFVDFMYKPVDSASLGVGRFAYGKFFFFFDTWV